MRTFPEIFSRGARRKTTGIIDKSFMSSKLSLDKFIDFYGESGKFVSIANFLYGINHFLQHMRLPCYSYLGILTLILIIFASCTNRRTAAALNEIEFFMKTSPQSALTALRAIDTTTLNTRASRAHYALLYAMALDKNWIDTTDANIVMPAVSYYSRHGSADQQMKSNYYLGRIQGNAQDINAAIISFTRAEIASEMSDDSSFKGLLAMAIADVYKKVHFTDKEYLYTQKGMNYFRTSGDTNHYNLSFGRLAMVCQKKREWEKADSLYRKGLVLAANDTLAMRMFLSHYAAMKVIQPHADPVGAIELLNNLYSEYKTVLPAKEYAIYAFASILNGDEDTCDAILSKLHSLPDDKRKESRFYEYLIAMHKKDYLYANSLLTTIYTEQDQAVGQMLNHSITETLQEYYRHQAITVHKLSQRRTIIFTIIVLGVLLFSSILIMRLFRRRERIQIEMENLTRMFNETNTTLLQTTSAYRSLQHSYIALFKNQFETIESLCRTYLHYSRKPEETRKNAIYKRVTDILSHIGKDRKYNALFEDQINRELDDIVLHLKEDLNIVKNEDILFVCYTIAGFDYKLVAALLNISLANVYTKRFRLKERILQLDSPHKEYYLQVMQVITD